VLATYASRPLPTLAFTTGADPFQFLVKATTDSAASHAAIGLGDQLLHAYEDGVLLESRDEWLGKRKQVLVAEFQILPDVTDGIARAMQHLGKKYDAMHVLKIWLLRLLHPAIRSLGPDAPDKFTCARFVTMIDPYGERIPEWRHLWMEAITPADLLDCALWGPSFHRIA
jgi:hypothetical protein